MPKTSLPEKLRLAVRLEAELADTAPLQSITASNSAVTIHLRDFDQWQSVVDRYDMRFTQGHWAWSAWQTTIDDIWVILFAPPEAVLTITPAST